MVLIRMSAGVQLADTVFVRELFLYHLYSGQLFFTACVLFIAAVVLDLSPIAERRPPLRRAGGSAAALAIGLAALSGTPMPLVLAVLTTVATGTYVAVGPANRRLRVPLAIGAAILVIVSLLVEVRWQASPSGNLAHPSRIIVIGDSLSSGGFGEEVAWPELLGRELEVPVENLSMPSETARGAVANQLPRLTVSGSREDLVIVAVGGNDMLDGVGSEPFARALETIVRSAAAGERQVVVIEIPLLPGRWAYGAAQRRVAKKNGARLLPKRLLARVLLTPGNTEDGIHLTQRGHEAMARTVKSCMTPK